MARKNKFLKYRVEEVLKENELNKILKTQKVTKEKSAFLFISQWDDMSSRLVKKLEAKYESSSNPGAVPLYVVNSFDTPHAFVIFDTKTVPSLVVVDGDDIQKEAYIPNIYYKLGV